MARSSACKWGQAELMRDLPVNGATITWPLRPVDLYSTNRAIHVTCHRGRVHRRAPTFPAPSPANLQRSRPHSSAPPRPPSPTSVNGSIAAVPRRRPTTGRAPAPTAPQIWISAPASAAHAPVGTPRPLYYHVTAGTGPASLEGGGRLLQPTWAAGGAGLIGDWWVRRPLRFPKLPEGTAYVRRASPTALDPRLNC